MDLAQIQPRWTTKHDFMVEIPQNTLIDEAMEEPDEVDEPPSGLPQLGKQGSALRFGFAEPPQGRLQTDRAAFAN